MKGVGAQAGPPSPGENGQRFDLVAAMPAIRSVMKATMSISLICVLISSLIIMRGSGAFTSDLAVREAIRGVLPMTIATLSFHASAVTLEGLLLVKQVGGGV